MPSRSTLTTTGRLYRCPRWNSSSRKLAPSWPSSGLSDLKRMSRQPSKSRSRGRRAAAESSCRRARRRGPRPLHNVRVAERRRRRGGGRRRVGLGGSGRGQARAGSTTMLTSSARRDRSCIWVIQAGRSGWTQARRWDFRRQAGQGHGAKAPLLGLVRTIASSPMLKFELMR